MCNFSPPLGDVEAVDPAPGSPVIGPVRLEFEDTQMTASAAITVDSTSIVYMGYTNSSGNFMGAVRNYCYTLDDYAIVHVFVLSVFKPSSTSLQPHFYLPLETHSTQE